MPSSELALEIQGLHARYGVIPAIRGVDLQVGRGELVTVVGPNGAGKTTLLRVLSGLHPPAEGKTSFFGRDTASLSSWQLAKLGIAHVPQGRRCFAGLTVEENLVVGGTRLSKREAARQMDGVFNTFPALHEKRRQWAEELSGGQQQMLAIGRALMSAPEVLLLDEPSLGLSPVLVQEMANTLRRLAREVDAAVLLAEQNTRLALKVSARAYVLRGGQVVLEGKSEKIADDVQKAYLGETGALAD
ncbi:ABC transporter ATP-binding protein [Minwuia thermotolerans]|uniref:ABC transporter ATP-binding protein n=1 Tax=Minwuia thermotolerans TaxID=2056226 RepID=UPI000D6DC401|nr:ABC transporter ATP-binding protein [Minwuia thermotolerans]